MTSEMDSYLNQQMLSEKVAVKTLRVQVGK